PPTVCRGASFRVDRAPLRFRFVCIFPFPASIYFCKSKCILYRSSFVGRVTNPDPVDVGGLEAGFSSAKKQILLTLKRQGSVSLTDLAASLGISKMATLKHLAVLEGKGLVERSSRAAGRGRPRAFFALSRGSTGLFPEAS